MLTILVAALLAAAPPPLLARPKRQCTPRCFSLYTYQRVSAKEYAVTYSGPGGGPNTGRFAPPPFIVRTLKKDTIRGTGLTTITLCEERHEQQYTKDGFPMKVWVYDEAPKDQCVQRWNRK